MGSPKMLYIFGEEEQSNDKAMFFALVAKMSKSADCDMGRRGGMADAWDLKSCAFPLKNLINASVAEWQTHGT